MAPLQLLMAILESVMRQEKGIRGIRSEMEEIKISLLIYNKVVFRRLKKFYKSLEIIEKNFPKRSRYKTKLVICVSKYQQQST